MTDRSEYYRRYNQEHREERNAFRRAHPEYGRRYFERHKDEIYARAAERRHANPEVVRERRRRYHEAHPEANRRTTVGVYGLSLEGYEALAAAQGGACAICGVTPQGNLHVDHDHATGRVRGLLCGSCNAGLGKLGDDADRLRAAIAYLERATAPADPARETAP